MLKNKPADAGTGFAIDEETNGNKKEKGREKDDNGEEK